MSEENKTKKKRLVIDARSREEYNLGHKYGAVCQEDLKDYNLHDYEELEIYCRSGARANKLAHEIDAELKTTPIWLGDNFEG